MNIKTIVYIQTFLTLLIFSSLYYIFLRLNEIFDKNETKVSNEEELKVGVIEDNYIVVLYDNATFIDEFTRTNWIKSAIDGNTENFSKIIHYYSIPSYSGWNTPSESLRLLTKNNEGEDTKVFKGFSARLSPEMYQYFLNHPSVKYIENDSAVKIDDIVEDDFINESEIEEDNEINTAGYVYYLSHCRWNLDRLENHEKTENEDYIYKFSYESASNVYIYVLDTGVYDGHSSFTDRIGGDLSKKRVTLGKNFIDNEENADLHGHGTHVAGIAGSTDFGVAKRANIVSVKVMNKSGIGKWSNIIAAFEWSINHLKTTGSKKGVINLSLSGNQSTAAIDAMKSTVGQGMNIAAAAGNNGDNACNHTPGSSSSDGIVVVGNIDVDDQIAASSNYGKCITVFAPGTKITSTANYNNEKKVMSGTSMASPHVAGVMALLLSIKDMTPKELYSELKSLATTGYIQDIDDESPNLIAFIPRAAYVFDRDTLPIPPSINNGDESNKSNKQNKILNIQ
ncbi:subtilisin-like protein [Anaeromyces robustus]|uniref:Subtilisin-like protein n=1 Tax=Anaeromyces robustus TaxID=1754192 RepID=A0A1Y1WU86_9FUNG|nr:subtilisin-like protein [Anaeromyces robustus]|eukprot:ORX77110.1 subtilisin-like protein [Anaeromyces robustus]